MEDVMQIKRNSAEFRKVRNYILEHHNSSTGTKAITLYAIKPYEHLTDRVLLRHRTKEERMIYDLALEQLIFNITDARHKLFRDETTGIYFFKVSAKSTQTEVPFELRIKTS
jgi:hypothetical protein